jgi:hypothetical protein
VIAVPIMVGPWLWSVVNRRQSEPDLLEEAFLVIPDVNAVPTERSVTCRD